MAGVTVRSAAQPFVSLGSTGKNKKTKNFTRNCTNKAVIFHARSAVVTHTHTHPHSHMHSIHPQAPE